MPVYAFFCDLLHIISACFVCAAHGLGYEKPHRGRAGRGVLSAILTRANESSILKCHVQVGEARHYATFFCSRPRVLYGSGPFSYFLRNPQLACGNRPFPLVAVHGDVHSLAAFPEITGIRGTGCRHGDGLTFAAYLGSVEKTASRNYRCQIRTF